MGNQQGISAVLVGRAVAEQARHILGRDLDQRTLDAVYERSEGNPLFVEALLSRDGEINGELPESLRDLILGSVRRLPEETQEMRTRPRGCGAAEIADGLGARPLRERIELCARRDRPPPPAHPVSEP